MKPARFDYHQARSVEEALVVLNRYGYDAKVLAGGQSLVPAMNLRLARPAVLVDINRVSELDYTVVQEEALRIGSLVRHQAFESPPVGGPLGRLLSLAAHHVGHLPIRVRGTFGGSIAHADPAAEWCMIAMLLDGEMMAASMTGTRTIPAARFFRTVFTTDLGPDELLIETRLVRPSPSYQVGFQQFSRRAGDFALAMAAVVLEVREDEVVDVRIALGAVSDRPIRASASEEYLLGGPATSPAFARAAEVAAREVEPVGDIHGSAEYRRDLVRALTRRALEQAIAQ